MLQELTEPIGIQTGLQFRFTASGEADAGTAVLGIKARAFAHRASIDPTVAGDSQRIFATVETRSL